MVLGDPDCLVVVEGDDFQQLRNGGITAALDELRVNRRYRAMDILLACPLEVGEANRYVGYVVQRLQQAAHQGEQFEVRPELWSEYSVLTVTRRAPP